MSTSEQERWFGQARVDLDAARSMLRASHYSYVLFCCQQSCEKALKGRVVMSSEASPPRIHQLGRLVELANLELGDDVVEFLRELSSYYIASRYPDAWSENSQVDRNLAESVLRRTEEVVKCLLSIQ